MQDADVIGSRLLSAEIGCCDVREIWTMKGPNVEPIVKTFGYLQARIIVAGVDKRDFDPGFPLVDDGLERGSEPTLPVAARDYYGKPRLLHRLPDAPISSG
jgi:hypothetical protein